MEINKRVKQNSLDVTLSGRFTFSDHAVFREILQQMAEPDVQQIVLSLEHLEFVDSAALGMLLLARDEAEKHQKHLLLSGATGQVKKMFDMARFHTLFTIL